MKKLYTGNMRSGKSKALIKEYIASLEDVDKSKILVVKHSIDTRDDGVIFSRHYGDLQLKCKLVSSTQELQALIQKHQPEVLFIDEAQFFKPDLADLVKPLQIKVIISGLDYDSDQREWETTKALKPIVNEVITLKARCTVCDEPSSWTAKIGGPKTRIAIEGKKTIFEPRCDEHYRRI